MNSLDIDINKCRCFWNCFALVSFYKDFDGYNMIKFLLMIIVFYFFLDGFLLKIIGFKFFVVWGNNCFKLF